HVVVNNNIGFTTKPEDSRTATYCTDIAKSIGAPVLHVNGEDPEAVVTVAKLAAEYRQRYRKDIFIDMWCYRKYGHNEQDEQSFTQPVLAKLIKQKKSVMNVYAEQMRQEGIISEHDHSLLQKRINETFDTAQQIARTSPKDPTIDPGSERWAGFEHGYSFVPADTSVSQQHLKDVCKALGTVPEGFKVNRKLKQLLESRSKLWDGGKISYADGEILAYGTLLEEGHAVRLSGQDSRRGTFSSRHAVLYDAETGEPYTPLNNICEMGIFGTDKAPGTLDETGRRRQAKFCVYDSPLSEASVLAFDYGYSLADPNMLVCWEAQFGDFVNGAQAIIDQFVASAQVKWERWSGLVMLLPHGYEGAGPEHSSARMERFLQLAGNTNIQVIHPSTGAQIFHALRRQVKRSFRKPLIVMTPKSLLRVPTSDVSELTSGRFREMIDDPMFDQLGGDRSKVRRVVLCCGKIYHELAARRDELGLKDLAILRFEQLYPFHSEMAREMLARYPKDAEYCWVQEEPRNMGAYLFMADTLREQLGMDSLHYIGRDTSASPAAGSKKKDRAQQESVITDAIGAKASADKVQGKDDSNQSDDRPALAAG
ncbi:MAG TPA: 2-oxoglutarate dehydrogenase E1 component, partial [Phycisphaerales bacterium]|nr:2-oxoglutarate dehydrogenase E1 component [Phycisphaerales bacterium]